MGLEHLYREVMDLNQLENLDKRKEAAKAFFEKLNHMELPAHFNWVEEIFEGLHVRERGNQLALVWADIETGADRKVTYAELAAQGNKCLNFLRKKGVGQGDNMYMMIPIIPETWFTTLASLKGGLINVPTATSMTVRELKFRFEAYPPDCIVTSQTGADLMDEALSTLTAKPKVKIILGKKDGWTSYSELENESAQAEGAKIRKEDVLFCFFTSGTTGLPKRVGHSAVSYPIGHISTAVMIGMRPGDVHHNLSAPGWAKWAWSSFFAPFAVGGTVAGFDFKALVPKTYLEFVSKYKVNTFCAPPTAWRAFVGVDLSQIKFDALRSSVSAGEPLNPEVIQKWKRFTGTEIRDFYGQTESTAMIGNAPWMEGKMRFGSFGMPSFMYDIALADDSGNEITSPGETGHIVVRTDRWRGMGLFQEYIGDPKKMGQVFMGNYYYTGDRAQMDEDGYWWFVGRADDVIKSSDYRVGPFEVESALIEHPGVAEAAVVGSPDPERYQLVKGYVILAQGYTPSRELALELFQHCINVLAKFKIPRIIEFVKEVPKTISGKIRRIELRDQETKRKESGESKAANEYFYWEFPELSSKKKKN
jgi:4-hydroxybutyrate---CoA ligase (AMP-forming)